MKHKTVFGALQVGPYGMQDADVAWANYLLVEQLWCYRPPWQPIALNWGKKPLGQEGKK